MSVDGGREKLKVGPINSVKSLPTVTKDLHFSKKKITEFIPGKKVVWQVLDGYLNFVADKNEWTGTKIIFEISKKDDKKTEVRFTHKGLVPQFECYNACSNAWSSFINGSLKDLITTGIGQPNEKENETNP
jgi:hypothetical protein